MPHGISKYLTVPFILINRFLGVFFHYKWIFSKDKNQIKTKKIFSSVGIMRYKRLLHKEKFLKTRTSKSDAEYKTYKNMFETIKRKS